MHASDVCMHRPSQPAAEAVSIYSLLLLRASLSVCPSFYPFFLSVFLSISIYLFLGLDLDMPELSTSFSVQQFPLL